MRIFPDPYDTSDPARSYFHWFLKYAHKAESSPILKLFRDKAPDPALRLARSARSIWRSLSQSA